ncbi:MAG: glycine cleavage system aminomethyltransferase GcvT [Spirochaetales bacterium]|uniref:aminomethyltransferase n=1 Tax=Candidatus Thalassospirochaeta sargassi TaxID=3119039 RepID=A0AAJ1MK09_9SPIO|nr:glycine cleavage system aminomethyltransferase GcvT [Spirochaetales bacterium]
MNNIGNPKKTSLYNQHLKLSGKIIDFSGWLLPVQYKGIIVEHLHTREKNSIFDISHMGEFLIEGKNAESDLSIILTTDVTNMKTGTCRYGFILNENAGIIDDTILYKFTPTRFMLVVNASRTRIDYNWIIDNISNETTVTDISDKTAKIDLQGPLSRQTASICFANINFNQLKHFYFTEIKWKGIPLTISMTGYTGETGYELFLPEDAALELWESLLSIGDVEPAGLGARDSLRLEKGYSLYGHDLTDKINPYEAGLGRFIKRESGFIGAAALNTFREKKQNRLLVPFICEGRRSARDGFTIMNADKAIGRVTSGSFSPSLKRGIGLGMIEYEFAVEGKELICTDGKIKINATVTELPFV